MTAVNTQHPPTDSAQGASLTHHAARGMAWGSVAAVTDRIVSMAVQVLLTYILLKGDFGTWALAMPVVMLAGMVQQAGIREVLMHRRDKIHLWTGPAFWMSLALGLLGTVAVLAAAWPMARVYENAELGVVVAALALTPVLRGATTVPEALLVESMRFRASAALYCATSIATSLLYLGLALVGLGAMSFALALPLVEGARAVVIWRLTRPRVGRSPRMSRWRYLARDSGLVLGSNLAKWARGYGDYLILGLFVDAAAVGVYFFAFSLSIQTFRLITLNLATVLLPTLSRLKEEPERQTGAFLRAARAMMFIGTPMCLGMAATAGPMVRGFLDPVKWATLPAVLMVVSVGMSFRLLDEPVQSLMNAQGRFRTFFRASWAMVAVFLAAATAGAWTGGMMGAAISVAVCSTVMGPGLVWLAIRRRGGGLANVVRVFGVPLLLSAAAIGPAMLMERGLPPGGRLREGVAIAMMIGVSGVLYVALATLLRLGEWREMLERVAAMAPARVRPFMRPLLAMAGRGGGGGD